MKSFGKVPHISTPSLLSRQLIFFVQIFKSQISREKMKNEERMDGTNASNYVDFMC